MGSLRNSRWGDLTANKDWLDQLLEDLERTSNGDEFDKVWDDVYDLADEERVWIATR